MIVYEICIVGGDGFFAVERPVFGLSPARTVRTEMEVVRAASPEAAAKDLMGERMKLHVNPQHVAYVLEHDVDD